MAFWVVEHREGGAVAVHGPIPDEREAWRLCGRLAVREETKRAWPYEAPEGATSEAVLRGEVKVRLCGSTPAPGDESKRENNQKEGSTR